MSQQNSAIAADVEKVLAAAKWPQGRSLEQALIDIEAVLKLMLGKLNDNKISVGYRAMEATDPGPHG
jgi:predicted RNase H-like HicB family nuclease